MPAKGALIGMVAGAVLAIIFGLAIASCLSGCCERDILGDCIHRHPGSTNSLSPRDLDVLANGSD